MIHLAQDDPAYFLDFDALASAVIANSRSQFL